jgi:pyruvate dehydrogenase (quinone)
MRYPTEVNIVADAAATLRTLLPHLERKADRSWRETVEKNVGGWWETLARQAMLDADPVNPMRIVSELSQRLPTNAIVTADSGSSANWYARLLRIRGEVRGSLSGTLATMGAAVPYAIGAKFAHPDRPAIAITGDGAMQMNGLAELLTIARYADRWSDPRCVICVLHNNDLNQVTWELRAMGGAPKFEPSQVLPDVSYADFARGIGLEAITVRTPDELGPAWDRVLSADRPAVLDVYCDPEVPTIPPHATFDEAFSTLTAVLKGDPAAVHLAVQGAKSKLQEFLPGGPQ